MITNGFNAARYFQFGDDDPPTPSPNQPGKLGEQLVIVCLSIYLGETNDTPARDQWDRARRDVLGVRR